MLLLIGGAVINADTMWEFADFMNALMIFPNAIALLILSPLVFKVSRDYDRQKKSGNANPKWDYSRTPEDIRKLK